MNQHVFDDSRSSTSVSSTNVYNEKCHTVTTCPLESSSTITTSSLVIAKGCNRPSHMQYLSVQVDDNTEIRDAHPHT